MKNLKNSKTKKIIQKSFIELLEKGTIDNITVVSICKKAKIERKTFYLHYKEIAFYFKYKFEKLLEIILEEEIKNGKDIVNDEIKNMNRDLMLVFLVSFVSGIVYAFVNGKLQRTTKEITIDIIKLLEPYIYVWEWKIK